MKDFRNNSEARVLYSLLITANEGGFSRVLAVNDDGMDAIQSLKDMGFYVKQQEHVQGEAQIFFIDWCKQLDKFEVGPALILSFAISAKVHRLMFLQDHGKNIDREVERLPDNVKMILMEYLDEFSIERAFLDPRLKKIHIAELFKVICDYRRP